MAEKNAVLSIENDPAAAFEREIRIRTQTALAVREKLHVAVELPAEVDAGASDKRLGKMRVDANDGAGIEGDDRVPIMWRSCRRTDLADHERALAERIPGARRGAKAHRQRMSLPLR